jgi:hypothetical protein
MAKKKTYAAVMDDMSKKLKSYETRLQEAQQRGDAVGIQDYGRRIQRVQAGMETLFQTQEASKTPQMGMGGLLKQYGPGGLTQSSFAEYKMLNAMLPQERSAEDNARLKALQADVDAATKLGWNEDFGFNPDGSIAGRPMGAAKSVTDAPPQEPYTGPSITPQGALDRIGQQSGPSFNQGPAGPYAANEITVSTPPGAPATTEPTRPTTRPQTPNADPRRVPVGRQPGAQPMRQETVETPYSLGRSPADGRPRTIPADGSYPGAAVNEAGEYMLMTDPSGMEVVITPEMYADFGSGNFGTKFQRGDYNDQAIFFDPDAYKGAIRTLPPGAQYTGNQTFSTEVPPTVEERPERTGTLEVEVPNAGANLGDPVTVGDVTGIGTETGATTDATAGGTADADAAVSAAAEAVAETTADANAAATEAGTSTGGDGTATGTTAGTTATGGLDALGNFFNSMSGKANPVAQYAQFAPDLFAAYQMEQVKGPADMPSQTMARRNTDIDYNAVYADQQRQLSESMEMIDRNISNPVVAAAMKRSAQNQAQQQMGQTRTEEINQERQLQNQYASEIAQNQNVNRQIAAQNQQRNIDFGNERRATRARMLQQAGQKLGQIYGENQNRLMDQKRLGISALAYEGDMIQRMAQRYPELEKLLAGR